MKVDREQALQAVYKHARGMCFGQDWNKGTAAGFHRKALVDAVNAIKELPNMDASNHHGLDNERDNGEKCDACGVRYQAIYRVPDDVWQKICPAGTLGPYPEHQLGGLLCMECAWGRAKEQGITLYFEGRRDWW